MQLDRQQFAYRFYIIVGWVLLVLLLLDLATGGESTTQLLMIMFMGFPISGPLFLLVFVIPSVKSAKCAFFDSTDPVLFGWTLAHVAFWIFVINNLSEVFGFRVASKGIIYFVWGAYSIVGSSLNLLRRYFQRR